MEKGAKVMRWLVVIFMVCLPAICAGQAIPAQQKTFQDLLGEHAKRYKAGTNELQKSAVAHDLTEALRKLFANQPAGKPDLWIGTIKRMTTTGKGNAHLAVDIGQGITLENWNNEISDAGNKTLILAGSPLYKTLSAMSVGQRVRFEARIVRNAAFTEQGRFQDPEYIVRFGKIALL